MAQDFAANDACGPFSDAEVARVVLALDHNITRCRRARALGRLVDGRCVPLPVKPTRIELAVFASLAQTYGPGLLDHADFVPVLDCIIEQGAVVLVQQALWGERPDAVRLAARLLNARVPFEVLCGTWPEVFMSEAHTAMDRFRPRPPGNASHEAGADD